MKVLKIGGSSVSSAQRMKDVVTLINDGKQKIVVVSALADTTDSLAEIAMCLYNNEQKGASNIINSLKLAYLSHIDELYQTGEFRQKTIETVMSCFMKIESFVSEPFSAFEEKEVLAQGELIAASMIHFYLEEQGVNSCLLPALDFMRTKKNSVPDMDYLKEHLGKLMKRHPDAAMYITQGYICRNAYGHIDNLQRGGSDYTASLIGAAIEAEEIQIWTNIDGIHNNDPRFVENTAPVSQLNFDEAAKVAHFGAKILHPACILPAKQHHIPVRLLNTLQPSAPGTLISDVAEKGKIKVVAAKDHITYVKIKSYNSLQTPQFLSKVFDTFSKYLTPIDLVTTSDVGVAVAIDNNVQLSEIIHEIERDASVTVEEDMVILCVVGDLECENIGFPAKIIDALRDIPVRMISYGGSNSNVSVLVRSEFKQQALQMLSNKLF